MAQRSAHQLAEPNLRDLFCRGVINRASTFHPWRANPKKECIAKVILALPTMVSSTLVTSVKGRISYEARPRRSCTAETFPRHQTSKEGRKSRKNQATNNGSESILNTLSRLHKIDRNCSNERGKGNEGQEKSCPHFIPLPFEL
jgi:hypothetical protein